MAEKTTTKKAEAKIKESEEYILAVIDKKRFNRVTGQKLSNAYPCTFNRVEWTQFQEFGPKLGFFLDEILEAPAGLDLTYNNPA